MLYMQKYFLLYPGCVQPFDILRILKLSSLPPPSKEAKYRRTGGQLASDLTSYNNCRQEPLVGTHYSLTVSLPKGFPSNTDAKGKD
jgi:hypothetical protein